MRRGAILRMGLTQLTGWGVSYYVMGVFGEYMTAELGWGRATVYGGFSAALVVMGLVSPLVGRNIDRFGGRRIMALGSLLAAIGLTGLAASSTLLPYYLSWICLGLAMRAMLYDAAFAALTRLYGAMARGPMAQITLLGGLASTCLWPLGHALAEAIGWRGALVTYAALALATMPLHLSLPKVHAASKPLLPMPAPAAARPTPLTSPLAAWLYTLIVALTTGLSTGMSAHLISLLQGLGLPIALAVSLAAIFGIGQFLARLTVVFFAQAAGPMTIHLIGISLLPLAFVCGLGGAFAPLAAALVLCYGVGNGVLSITRGTLPLVLFDHATYGSFVGKLLAPSFLVAAVSPLGLAWIIERFGTRGGLLVALGVAVIVVAASLCLAALTRCAARGQCPVAP